MLKTRVIPTLLHRGSQLVKGVRFSADRPVGSAVQAIKVYNRRGVDELVFLDVTASAEGRPPDFALIDELADECFMPLTVGGGVRSIADVRDLLAVGADKVAINTAALANETLISEAAAKFGVQCVVVAVDVRREGDGETAGWRVMSRAGTTATDWEPVAWAQRVEALGAGEILLQSIDRDGTMEGYDLEVIRAVADAVRIPVVASGGAGSYADMAAAVAAGASAVAAASIFHFTEMTPREAKLHLREQGAPVRL
jgi:cyclase